MFISEEIKEPIILEPDDWTPGAFDIFRELFHRNGANKIVIREGAIIESWTPTEIAAHNRNRLASYERALDAIMLDMTSREQPSTIAGWLKKIGVNIADAREIARIDEDTLRKAYGVDAEQTVEAGINP